MPVEEQKLKIEPSNDGEKLQINELPPLVTTPEASEDKKPTIEPQIKSSMEILSELFECFDAEPPLIIKKEKSDSTCKKVKKSKRKHKHKEKKHKKNKDKKRVKRENDESSSSDEKSEIDLAEIFIKQEKESSEKKIKIEGTELSFPLSKINTKPETSEKLKKTEKPKKSAKVVEDGEICDSDSEKAERKSNKRKHKSESEPAKKKKRSRSKEPITCDDLRNKIKDKNKERRSRSRENDFYKPRENDFYKIKESDFYRSRNKDEFYRRERDEHRNRGKERDKKERSEAKRPRLEEDYYKSSREKFNRDRERSHRERLDYIDKKKLLEIARKNAIQMMKSGSLPGALTLGPQAQEKVIAAIKAGGKTIEELTDFCKTLSKKEAIGDLSSDPEDNGSESDTERPFHHPFQIKDRPTSITMNIKNSVPLPTKTTQERSSELRLQFPVSSGQLHRKSENEWVPVSSSKKTETVSAKAAPPVPAPVPAPVPEPVEVVPVADTASSVVGPKIFPENSTDPSVDISSIVSLRLTAMRKLQENPNDVQALTEIYKSNKEMQSWAQSKKQFGQFTGSTGAQILTQAELSSGYQAWAKKDQLQNSAPVSGGMGMHLLQKMGWKPGEGLGKEKTGALEPLLLEVKLDKKGLVANEEQKKKKRQQQQQQITSQYSLQNKHPVSLLGEFASKKKLGAPEYNLCFECGPDHKKNFLFKVVLNGIEYKPNIASPNKKEAKATAATACLQQLGLLPVAPM